MAQRTPAPSGAKKSFPVVPVLSLVLLVSAALYAAGLAGKVRTSAEKPVQEPGYVPFSSLPEEAPPDRAAGPGGSGGRTRGSARLGRAADGSDEVPAAGSLLDDAVWLGALAEGRQGYALAREAVAARQVGNHALFQEKGGGAKRAFDRALIQSVPWVERLIVRHGDANSSVRKALAIQGRWREQLIAFHKTTGR